MNEFLILIETNQVEIPTLMQVCHAPLAVLLQWFEDGAPETALADLKQFLQG